MIGTSVAEKLTGSAETDLTGQLISVNSQQFRVVGMLASKGVAGPGGDQDDIIVMPINTAMRRVLNKQFLNSIAVRCVDAPTTLLSAVAVISLLVGGIGIMNIMLVSVTEPPPTISGSSFSSSPRFSRSAVALWGSR